MLSLPVHRRRRVSLSDAPERTHTQQGSGKDNEVASNEHVDTRIVVILKRKKQLSTINNTANAAPPAKKKRKVSQLPTGVKLISPHYSSGTDEDEMDDTPAVGQGFPPSLRTLEKDTILMKKQFPGTTNNYACSFQSVVR